jgi:hypothetical protein
MMTQPRRMRRAVIMGLRQSVAAALKQSNETRAPTTRRHRFLGWRCLGSGLAGPHGLDLHPTSPKGVIGMQLSAVSLNGYKASPDASTTPSSENPP